MKPILRFSLLSASLVLGVCFGLACSGNSTSSRGDPSDAASSADARDGNTADAALTCEPQTCTNASRCAAIPYDTCGLVDDVCSCSIHCLESDDGGTNCFGNAPCKTSAEGTKYCSASAAE